MRRYTHLNLKKLDDFPKHVAARLRELLKEIEKKDDRVNINKVIRGLDRLKGDLTRRVEEEVV